MKENKIREIEKFEGFVEFFVVFVELFVRSFVDLIDISQLFVISQQLFVISHSVVIS